VNWNRKKRYILLIHFACRDVSGDEIFIPGGTCVLAADGEVERETPEGRRTPSRRCCLIFTPGTIIDPRHVEIIRSRRLLWAPGRPPFLQRSRRINRPANGCGFLCLGTKHDDRFFYSPLWARLSCKAPDELFNFLHKLPPSIRSNFYNIIWKFKKKL
jgi:hypothetical protein